MPQFQEGIALDADDARVTKTLERIVDLALGKEDPLARLAPRLKVVWIVTILDKPYGSVLGIDQMATYDRANLRAMTRTLERSSICLGA